MKLEFFQQIYEKFSNTKFYENPLSGSRVDPCGRTGMTKLTIAFAVLWTRLKTTRERLPAAKSAVRLRVVWTVERTYLLCWLPFIHWRTAHQVITERSF